MNKKYQKLILAICIAPSSGCLRVMAGHVETKYRSEAAAQAEIKAQADQSVAGLHDPETLLGVKIVWSQGQEVLVPYEAAQKAAVLKSLYEIKSVEGQLNYEFNLPDNFKTNNPSCSFALLSRVITYLSYSPAHVDTTLLDCTAADLLQIYKLSSYLGAAEISAAAIKALPQALARLAQESGLHAVKSFLDALNFNDQEASAIKKQLIQNNPWIRYCCGEPQEIGVLDFPGDIAVPHIPVWNSRGVMCIQGFEHFADARSIDLFENLTGKLTRSSRLKNNGIIGSFAWSPDSRKLVVLTGRMATLWRQHADAWISNEPVLISNDVPISIRWIDDNNIIFLVYNEQVNTQIGVRHWRVQENNLIFDHESIIHFEKGLYRPWINWSRGNDLAFIVSNSYDHEVDSFNGVCDYYQGNWRCKSLEERLTHYVWDAQKLSFMNFYGTNADAKKYITTWTRNEGEWTSAQQEVQAYFVEKNRVNRGGYCHAQMREGALSDHLTFFHYSSENYPEDFDAYVLRRQDNAWRLVGTVFQVSKTAFASGQYPFLSWNKQGTRLAVLTVDHRRIRILAFDAIEKLFMQEILLAMVVEQLKDSSAGVSVLQRDKIVLEESAKKSPALKSALRIKPAWYTKEGVTQRVQKVQRWIKKNPKAALALCVAGGLLAYYAKKRLAPRVKKSIIMPLAARLKRKASK